MKSERVKRLLGELGKGLTAGLLGRVCEWVMTESTTGLPQIVQEGAGGGAIPLMEVMKKVVVEVGVSGLAVCSLAKKLHD